jgi:hypothetical protein
MTQQDTKKAITADTIVTGAEFRDFYKNHWPKEWYVEEMPLEAEDERGEWVLPDDAKKPLKWFGYPCYQGPKNDTYSRGVMIEMHELYAKVMGTETPDVLVAFKIKAEGAQALVDMAIKMGARHI